MSIRINKTYFALLIIGASLGVFGFSDSVFAQGIIIDNFDLNPKLICSVAGSATQFRMTLKLTVNVTEIWTKCGNVNSFDWGIKKDITGVDPVLTKNNSSFNPALETIPMDLSRPVLIDTTGQYTLNTDLDADYYVAAFCPGSQTILGQITESSRVNIRYGGSSGSDPITGKPYPTSWACIADNNIFACSSASDCSDASACAGKPCVKIGSSLCGQSAVGASCTGATGIPGQPGEDVPLKWGIWNPLANLPGGGKPENVFDVIILITDWILNIAGTLVVMLIIYGGVMFLISAGNPGKIQQAKNILFWALVGFGAVLIGKGFVFLVESVLSGQTPIF